MFEFERKIVQALVDDDKQFAVLFNRHRRLKVKVRDAETGVIPLDELALGNMKKEKLAAKDRMAEMIQNYKRVNALC